MQICVYCGAERAEGGKCPGCQAEGSAGVSASQVVKGEPFHYNGYVVWWLADWAYDTAEYLFYLGDTLVERFTVSREVLHAFVPEHCTPMPFIWDLFLLAQGEEEVLRVVEQNTTKPVTFEITVKKDAEEHEAVGLSIQAIHEAVEAGRRRIVC